MKKNMKKLLSFILFSAFCNVTSVAYAATLDLLVLYDTDSYARMGRDPITAMTNWVNQINNAYASSQVDIRLRLVGTGLREDAGASMKDVLNNLRQDASVIALRDRLGADFVSQLHKTGSCGIGYAAVDKNWTWNVLSFGCGPMVMAHELGHNMGLHHSRRQGNTSGIRYRYGVGYGVDNLFVDIMAYGSAFNAPRQNRFSNPYIQCAGVSCGIPEGHPNEAYGAKAIHNVRDEMANFRPTKVPNVTTEKAKVFQHCGFGGYSASLSVGTYNLQQLVALGVRNDDLSSIQVPSGLRVTLYQHDGFAGSSLPRTANDDCLWNEGFNDTVSSIKVEAI